MSRFAPQEPRPRFFAALLAIWRKCESVSAVSVEAVTGVYPGLSLAITRDSLWLAASMRTTSRVGTLSGNRPGPAWRQGGRPRRGSRCSTRRPARRRYTTAGGPGARHSPRTRHGPRRVKLSTLKTSASRGARRKRSDIQCGPGPAPHRHEARRSIDPIERRLPAFARSVRTPEPFPGLSGSKGGVTFAPKRSIEEERSSGLKKAGLVGVFTFQPQKI